MSNFRTALMYCLCLGVFKWAFHFGLIFLQKLMSKSPMWCPFFCGQDNLLGEQFWAMGKLNSLGGQINLLGGLTCYLSSWSDILYIKNIYEWISSNRFVLKLNKYLICKIHNTRVFFLVLYPVWIKFVFFVWNGCSQILCTRNQLNS